MKASLRTKQDEDQQRQQTSRNDPSSEEYQLQWWEWQQLEQQYQRQQGMAARDARHPQEPLEATNTLDAQTANQQLAEESERRQKLLDSMLAAHIFRDRQANTSGTGSSYSDSTFAPSEHASGPQQTVTKEPIERSSDGVQQPRSASFPGAYDQVRGHLPVAADLTEGHIFKQSLAGLEGPPLLHADHSLLKQFLDDATQLDALDSSQHLRKVGNDPGLASGVVRETGLETSLEPSQQSLCKSDRTREHDHEGGRLLETQQPLYQCAAAAPEGVAACLARQ